MGHYEPKCRLSVNKTISLPVDLIIKVQACQEAMDKDFSSAVSQLLLLGLDAYKLANGVHHER